MSAVQIESTDRCGGLNDPAKTAVSAQRGALLPAVLSLRADAPAARTSTASPLGSIASDTELHHANPTMHGTSNRSAARRRAMAGRSPALAEAHFKIKRYEGEQVKLCAGFAHNVTVDKINSPCRGARGGKCECEGSTDTPIRE